MSSATPLPLFDTRTYIKESLTRMDVLPPYSLSDIEHGAAFLAAYKGCEGTFNSYRREVERLIHWSALIANKSLATLKRDDMEQYLLFAKNPPIHWIGHKKPPRFILNNGLRTPNVEWRPYIATCSKSSRRQGHTPDASQYQLSPSSLRELFAILGSFFGFLMQEEYMASNPIQLIRQKSQFIQKKQGPTQIRRLSELQWQYVIEYTKQLADSDPHLFERSLFVLSALYGMYLRISELAATERWTPCMRHFFRDSDNQWWFVTVSKGNKERQIAVSDAMLGALKRWRQCLSLSPLPSPADTSPLLVKLKGKGPMKSVNQIRRLVQQCFDHAIHQLQNDGFQEEADNLTEATAHWLRHTGISDDVKTRPREHVRDDAGHSSGATTDLYIDIHLHERYQSAKKKPISEND